MIGTLLPRPGRVAVVATLLVSALAAVLAIWLDTTAPSPRAATAPATEFSAERAAGQLAAFATRPRPGGSQANDDTRRHLVRELRAAGLRVRVQHGIGSYQSERGAVLGRVQNIVGTLPGRDSTGSVILAAHYDSVAAGPGASDDGSSVAAMLETLRAIRAAAPLRNDLVLLITDGEEAGLLGASAFTRDDPLAREPGVVLNWEARGVRGPSLMFETSPRNERLIELFAEGAPHPNGDSSLVELYRLLPNDTDFSRFSERLPGLNSAFIEGAEFYHTPQDTIANLDRGSLQQQGANMLGLSRTFGNVDLSTLDSGGEATYFRFLGLLVSYPDDAAIALGIIAMLLVIALAVFLRTRQLASVPRMLAGFASALVPLVVAAGLAFGLSLLVSETRPQLVNALYVGAPFGFAAAAIAVAAMAGWYALLRNRIGSAALAFACFGWLSVLGAVCLVLVPGMAFLFTIPGLVAAVGGLFALGLREFNESAPQLALLFGALPGVVFYVPFAVLNFTGLGLFGGGTVGVAIGVFLCAMALLPALDALFGRRARTAAMLPVGAAALAVLLCGAGLVVPQYDSTHPQRSFLSYVSRPDLRQASWVSTDTDPASWGRGFATTAGRDDTPAIFGDQPLWTASAPEITAPAPRARLVRDEDGRSTVRIGSARGAKILTVLLSGPGDVTVRAAGYDPVTVRVPKHPGPYSLTFVGLPRTGIELSTAAGTGLRFTAYDQTNGLSGVPGFRPRPSGVDRTANRMDDLVVVGRSYQFPAR